MSALGTGRASERQDLDVMAAARADFPALAQEVNGQPLVYLDSAASAQEPVVARDSGAAIAARRTGVVSARTCPVRGRIRESVGCLRTRSAGSLRGWGWEVAGGSLAGNVSSTAFS